MSLYVESFKNEVNPFALVFYDLIPKLEFTLMVGVFLKDLNIKKNKS
jgi:hypothetical protein